RRQMSARLMGQCRSTSPMISHRLEARMSFVWVIFINARPFLLWVLPIPVRKYYTILRQKSIVKSSGAREKPRSGKGGFPHALYPDQNQRIRFGGGRPGGEKPAGADHH